MLTNESDFIKSDDNSVGVEFLASVVATSPTPPSLSIMSNLPAFLSNRTNLTIPANVLQHYIENKAFEAKLAVIIPSIFAMVILLGLVGNLLVVIVAMNKQMRNSTNTLIIGLACSDLMFLTLCVPFTAIEYSSTVWVLPTWCCNVINYLQHSSAYFSVWTLTLMAGDRFLAVCFPVESMTLRTPRNTTIVLTIVYSVILVSQLQVGRIHGVYEYTYFFEKRSSCAIISITTSEATVVEARLYYLSFNIFGYILPLGITCIFYYYMLRRLWHIPRHSVNGSSASMDQLANNNSGSKTYSNFSGSNCQFPLMGSKLSVSNIPPPSPALKVRPETIRAKRKVTRLVLFVVIIWAVCWFPLNICFFFSAVLYPETVVTKGGKMAVIAQISSQVLAYTNSCLNPILYPLVSENFRKGFVQVLSKICYFLTLGRCYKARHIGHNRFLEVTNYRSTSQRLSKSNSRTFSTKLRQTSQGTINGIVSAQQANKSSKSSISVTTNDSFSLANGGGSMILKKFGIGSRRRSSNFRRMSNVTINITNERSGSDDQITERQKANGIHAMRTFTTYGNGIGIRKGNSQHIPAEVASDAASPKSSLITSAERKRRLKSISGNGTGNCWYEDTVVPEEPTSFNIGGQNECESSDSGEKMSFVEKEEKRDQPCKTEGWSNNTNQSNEAPKDKEKVQLPSQNVDLDVWRNVNSERTDQTHNGRDKYCPRTFQQRNEDFANGSISFEQQQEPEERSNDQVLMEQRCESRMTMTAKVASRISMADEIGSIGSSMDERNDITI